MQSNADKRLFQKPRRSVAAVAFIGCIAAASGLAMVSCAEAPAANPDVTGKGDAVAGSIAGYTLETRGSHMADNPPAASQSKFTALYETVEWPNVLYTSKGTPWNWSAGGQLLVSVQNLDNQAAEIGLRVDDSADADGTNHSVTGNAVIPAGQTATVLLDLKNQGKDAGDTGMKNAPPLPAALRKYTICNNVRGDIDAGHVTSFQIFMHHPSHPVKLEISDARIENLSIPADRYRGIVDRYGQYTGDEWPGKVHADGDLLAQKSAEAKDLEKYPHPPGIDEFGGWSGGPKLPASGYFRTAKVKDKWWLVTPTGHLFLSFGMDEMVSEEATFITNRETMFADLPSASGPFGQFFRQSDAFMGPIKHGTSYDFYRANLYRKYGQEYKNAWLDLTYKRMRSWGMNTVANWADSDFAVDNQAPYVINLGYPKKHKTVATGNDYWGQLPDAFDPQFAKDVDDGFRTQVPGFKDRRRLLGYFVDNELSWSGVDPVLKDYGIAVGALKVDGDSPSKQAFVKQLSAKYGDVGKLNAAWETSFTSWNELLDKPYAVPSKPSVEMKTDLAEFVSAFAGKYFGIVNEAIKRYDPNHLYLGCRFAWKTPEVIRAAAGKCDVISFNIYEATIRSAGLQDIEALDKPCLVSEFGFGATDRGMFGGGLVQVGSQEERAASLKAYMASVLGSPSFVGAHWFQYSDEPLTGRLFDGENYNDGMVNVADNPYPEIVTATRSVLWPAYERRYGK